MFLKLDVMAIHYSVLCISIYRFNSLPNEKILHWSKFQVIADDNFIVAILFESVENIKGKEENTNVYEKTLTTSIFSFSNYVFNRLLPEGYQRLSLCDKGLLKTCRGSHIV